MGPLKPLRIGGGLGRTQDTAEPDAERSDTGVSGLVRVRACVLHRKSPNEILINNCGVSL